jgi:lambda family phage tail tape measure protein
MTTKSVEIRIAASGEDAIRAFGDLKRSVAEAERQFQAARQRVGDFARQMQANQQTADGLKVQLALGRAELDRLAGTVGKSSVEYRALKQTVGQTEAALRAESSAVKSSTQSFETARREAGKLKDSLAQQTAALEQSRRALAAQGINAANLAGELRRLRTESAAAAAAQDALSRSQAAWNRLSEQGAAVAERVARRAAEEARLRRLAQSSAPPSPSPAPSEDSSSPMVLAGGKIARYAAGYLAVGSLVSAGRELLRTAAAWDRINASLTITQGSAKGAADALGFLRETSDKLGLELQPTADAFVRLAASARGTALEGEPTRKIFESVVGAMSRLGMSSARTQDALNALGQMMSKGVVQAEELRGQLGDHLPGAVQLAARALGVSTAKLMEMVSSGQLLASDLLPRLARELDKTFGTGRVDTLQSNLNRLGTAWDQLKAKLAENFRVKDVVGAAAEQVERLATEATATGPARNLEQLQAKHDALVKLIGEQEAKWGAAPLPYLKQLREVSAALEKIDRQQKATAEATAMGPPAPPKLSESDAVFLDSLKTADQKAVDAIQAKITQLKAIRDKVVAQLGEAKYESMRAALDQELAKAVKKASGAGDASRFDALFEAATGKYSLPPGLLKAIAWKESGFNPAARNGSGAAGIMQLMPDTAARYGVKDPHDPAQAIEGAAQYLAALMQELGGNVEHVIASYNSVKAYKMARAGNFDFGLLPAETKDYLPKVAGKMAEYGGMQIDLDERKRKIAEAADYFAAQQAREVAAAEDAAKRIRAAQETALAQLDADMAARENQRAGALIGLTGDARAQAEADQQAQAARDAEEYARRKAEIDKQGLDLEVQIARTKLNALQAERSQAAEFEKSAADRLQLDTRIAQAETELSTLAEKRRQVETKASADIAKAMQDEADARDAARRKALELTESGIQRRISGVDAMAQRIRAEQEAGLISGFEARNQLADAYRQTADAIAGAVRQYREFAQSQGDPELLANAERLTAAYVELGAKARTPLEALAQQWSDVGTQLEQVSTGWADSFASSIASAAMSGKLSFKDFAKSVLSDLAQLIARTLVANAVMKGLSLLGGLGGLGGGTNVAAAAGAGNGLGAINVGGLIPKAHSGGVIGEIPGSVRLPILAFAGAPKYHTGGIAGLQADEVPVVLRKGEEVLTEDDPRHRYNRKAGSAKAEGGGVNVSVSVTVNNGKSEGSVQADSVQGKQFGQAISQAVQQEILKQKRPGGLLHG